MTAVYTTPCGTGTPPRPGTPRRQTGDTRGRVAAPRRVVRLGARVAAVRGREDRAPGEHGRQRHQPAAERLAEQDDVGPARPDLAGQEAAGAAEPGLDLVGDEQ